MKNYLQNILVALFVVIASAAHGAVPSVNVSVSDSKGKVAFKGKTNANGVFSTGNLQPGNYVVQFTSNGAMSDGPYALVVSAGKKKFSAEGVTGEKFGKGGVAMKVEVAAANLKITGQVASGSKMAGGDNRNVKIINGKRFVWVKGEMGSNLGGRWVEEGSREDTNISRLNSDGIRAMQDRAGDTPQSGR